MPKPSVEPEAVGASALQPPHMPGTEAAAPVPMFPGMIEVIVGIVAATVMSHPDSAVDVRSIGMVGVIAEISVLVALVVMGAAVKRLRPASRRPMHLMFLAAASVFLHGKRWNANHQ